jgi:hypothetical protein
MPIQLLGWISGEVKLIDAEKASFFCGFLWKAAKISLSLRVELST